METIMKYTSIKEIDLSRNLFTDSISEEFSKLFKANEGNKSLSIIGLAGYKSEEVNDTQDYEYLQNSTNCIYSSSDDDDDEMNEYDMIKKEKCSDNGKEFIKKAKRKENNIQRESQSQNEKGDACSNRNGNSSSSSTSNQTSDEKNYSEFSFGNLGCQKIFKNLRYYSHLKALDLSYQQIENNTFEFLASELFYLPCLLLLDLQHNYITDNGLISFMDRIIEHNKDNTKAIQSTVNNNLDKNNSEKYQNNKRTDIETIINVEYNYISFMNCKENIKNFNCNSKTNYIVYARNQNIN